MTTTFLEFVCRELLGPPEGREGDSPTWPCPKCAKPKFHLRPPRAGNRDRFSCWSCDFWGDEADLLKQVFPEENYDDRLVRLSALRDEYGRSGASRPPAPALGAGKAGFSSRGAGSTPAANDPYDPDGPAVAFAAMSRREREVLAEAFALAGRHEVAVEALARYCFDFAEWVRKTGERHLADRDDLGSTRPTTRATTTAPTGSGLFPSECQRGETRSGRQRPGRP